MMSEEKKSDEQLLNQLRVQAWEDFQGQVKLKQALSIAIQAAKERQEAVDHVLLYGPPGLGKTTLAHLIAKQMQAGIRVSSGTVLNKASDLAAILTNLKPYDIFFIDEIHRLRKPVEEMLYSAMEDYCLDIVIGKGPSARTVRIDLPHFTLVGATTRYGALAGPFRDRFGVTHRVEHYDPQELLSILQKAANKLTVKIDDDSGIEIARRGRGTPRIALKLLKRVRDFAQVQGASLINEDIVKQALDLHAVDSLGLTDIDRKFLESIIDKHSGGPVGLTTIAATINEDPITIEEVIEPYLLQIGFLKKTPKGRVIGKRAYEHLGL